MAADLKRAAELNPQFEPVYHDAAAAYGLDLPATAARPASPPAPVVTPRQKQFSIILLSSVAAGCSSPSGSCTSSARAGRAPPCRRPRRPLPGCATCASSPPSPTPIPSASPGPGGMGVVYEPWTRPGAQGRHKDAFGRVPDRRPGQGAAPRRGAHGRGPAPIPTSWTSTPSSRTTGALPGLRVHRGPHRRRARGAHGPLSLDEARPS